MWMPATVHCAVLRWANRGTKTAEAHLVGKAPEEEGHHDGAPQLGHDVEEAERPVAQDCDRSHQPRAILLEQPLAEGCTQHQGESARKAGELEEACKLSTTLGGSTLAVM